MTRDRLAEFQKKTEGFQGATENGGFSPESPSSSNSIPSVKIVTNGAEIQNGSAASGDFMEKYFEEIDEIQDLLERIEKKVDLVKRKHSDILSSPDNNPEMKAEVEELMSEIKDLANQIRYRLKALDKDIEKREAKKVDHSQADLRIRKTQKNSIARNFVEVMNEYNRIQSDYRDRCKNRIQRQLSICGRKVTDEELEEELEKGEPGIFNEELILNNQRAKQTLDDIKARHNDILALEKSITELHDIFMDMMILVQEQGEMVDRIEFNVQNAEQYVEKAKKDVAQAATYQSSARRKKCICIIILVVVLAIIAAILGIYFGTKK